MKNNKTAVNLLTTKNFNMKDYLDKCNNLRPSSLIMDDLKWKYMVRSAVRGKNILLLGPTDVVRLWQLRLLLRYLVRSLVSFISILALRKMHVVL